VGVHEALTAREFCLSQFDFSATENICFTFCFLLVTNYFVEHYLIHGSLKSASYSYFSFLYVGPTDGRFQTPYVILYATVHDFYLRMFTVKNNGVPSVSIPHSFHTVCEYRYVSGVP
jgi:hypothetical protein